MRVSPEKAQAFLAAHLGLVEQEYADSLRKGVVDPVILVLDAARHDPHWIAHASGLAPGSVEKMLAEGRRRGARPTIVTVVPLAEAEGSLLGASPLAPGSLRRLVADGIVPVILGFRGRTFLTGMEGTNAQSCFGKASAGATQSP